MPVPWIQQLLTQVSHSYYRHVIEHLVSFSTRHSTSEHYQTAAVWCRREFTRLGYDASLQVVRLDEGNSYNVIADKSGFGAERRKLLLLVAHLDSINSVGGQLAAAPGADDNASGCAGALSIADALKDHCAVNDLRIVLFGGEEQGLLGSIQYVEETAATELDRVAAVVNMDMIASMNTPTPTVLLEGSVVSHAVINQLKQAAATYTSLTVQTSLNAFGSDHVPFIRANIPAVLAIEGADRSNENIHTDKDVLAYLCDSLALDIQKMTLSFLAKELGNYGH